MLTMARALLWVHIVYLLAIPLAGVASIGGITQHAPTAYLGGWLVAAVYLAVQAKYYRLPRRPLAAALTVAVVPLQVAAHVAIWDGGVQEYLVEEAFLELSSLALALGMVMLAYRPSGWGGAGLGIVMAAIAVYGFGWPLAQAYLRHGAGPEVWGLLALALATGTWAHVRLVAPAAKGEIGEPSPDGGGVLARLIDRLAPSRDEDLASPISQGAVAVLIVVQCLLWLIVPGIANAIR